MFLFGGGKPQRYRIRRSLRFNSADSASLSYTPGSSGNRDLLTLFFAFKRAKLSSFQKLLEAYTNTNNRSGIQFRDDNTLQIYTVSGGSNILNKISTAVFRDTAAFMYITVQIDTVNSAYRVWIGENEITTWGTNTTPSAGTDTFFFHNIAHYIGKSGDNVDYLDGYLAEPIFVEGAALDYTAFLEQDPATGSWVRKSFAGGYGTRGSRLDFSDSSNTTSGTLGKDRSGNNNDWTPSNFSVTAGVGNDSLTDTPTNYGTDAGAGGEVRGNYCTLNPISNSIAYTLTNGNLDIANGSVARGTKPASFFLTSGKWYWEVVGNGYAGGVCGPTGTAFANTLSTAGSNGIGYWEGGQVYWDGGSSGAGPASYTSSDVIGVALNMDAGTVAFYKNNTLQHTATFGVSTVPNLSSGCFPVYNDGFTASTKSAVFNFGQRPFTYAAPSGFKALCTQNLPTPAILKPSQYFDAYLYTGNGSGSMAQRDLAASSFQPDLVWIKGRSGATDNAVYDAVRGVQKRLETNNTDAEVTGDSTGLTAFNSNGFGIKELAQINTNAATYVAWLWKAGGAAVSNSSGSISGGSMVSVNAAAGISIVNYTGSGSNATVGHGLGVQPSLIINKRQSGAGNDWNIWSKAVTDALGASYNIALNTTSAAATSATVWNSTAPTSSVFSIGTAGGTNTSGSSHVAYCFAEVPGFSKFGSYTGNGSADGPFVWCGFKPRWILIKRTDAGGNNWRIWDTARAVYNAGLAELYPDSTGVEDATLSTYDILSNGFKLRGTGAGINGSTSTYLFAAFAEMPFKFATGR